MSSVAWLIGASTAFLSLVVVGLYFLWKAIAELTMLSGNLIELAGKTHDLYEGLIESSGELDCEGELPGERPLSH